MNKTININLGGVFFHIDEDAYQILKTYLTAIRQSLSDDPQGKDEIIKDIEYRIGEILGEKIKDVRQVVNQQDIDDIILIMGKPEQYAGDDEFFEDDTSTHPPKGKTKSRKLYRDTDDKFLGGVSSGLGHYFGVDVIWIRLGWLLLLISGFSVILYPILWILLPEANTTAEKLEMEGEPVNISNIERKIKEELTIASQLVKEGFEDVSENFKKGDYQEKVKSGVQDIIDLLVKVFAAIFKVTGKFVGILLVVISIATLIVLFLSGFSIGSAEFLGISDSVASYPPFFYTSRLPLGVLITLTFIAIGIPFVLLFKLGLKIISSNVSSFSRATNLSLLGVWLIALMGLGFSGIEYAAHYSNKFMISDKHVLHTQLSDTLKIKMRAKDDYKLKHTKVKPVLFEGVEKAYKTNITLDIRESNTGELYLKVYKKAYGLDIDEAKDLVNDIDYKFEITNNTLLLDAFFLADIEDSHNAQELKLILYVPKGQLIYLDKTTKYFLSDVDNIQDVYDRRMIKHHYKMISDGLDCLDCDSDSKQIEISITTTPDENIDAIEDAIIDNEDTQDAEDIHKSIEKQLNEKLH